MTISFTDPSLPGQLQEGQVQTRRLQGGVRQWRRQPAQALIDPLYVFPGAAVFFAGLQPALHGQLLAAVEGTALQFDQPVHRLLGDLGAKAAVHRAK